MKSRKFLFALVLAFVLCLSTSVAMADVEVSNYTDFSSALGGTDDTITLTGCIEIPVGTDLSLKGKTIQCGSEKKYLKFLGSSTVTGGTITGSRFLIVANKSANVTLNNVELSGTYPIYLFGNNTLTINECEINGWSAIQIKGGNNNIEINQSKIISTNLNDGDNNDFAAFVFYSNNNTLTMKDTTVNTAQHGTGKQHIFKFGLDNSASGGTSYTGSKNLLNISTSTFISDGNAPILASDNGSGNTLNLLTAGILFENGGITNAADLGIEVNLGASNLVIDRTSDGYVVSQIAAAITDSSSLPKTGDNTPIAFLISLMAISAISLMTLGRKSRFN